MGLREIINNRITSLKNFFSGLDIQEDEQMVVIELLATMMAADGDVSQDEIAKLREVSKELGLDFESITPGNLNLNLSDHLVKIKDWSDDDKEKLVNLLYEMMQADGKVAPGEVHVLKKVVEEGRVTNIDKNVREVIEGSEVSDDLTGDIFILKKDVELYDLDESEVQAAGGAVSYVEKLHDEIIDTLNNETGQAVNASFYLFPNDDGGYIKFDSSTDEVVEKLEQFVNPKELLELRITVFMEPGDYWQSAFLVLSDVVGDVTVYGAQSSDALDIIMQAYMDGDLDSGVFMDFDEAVYYTNQFEEWELERDVFEPEFYK